MSKRIGILLAVLMSVMLLNSISVEAAEQIADGLEISLSVEQASQGSQYVAQLKLKNTNAFPLENIVLDTHIPDGFSPLDSDWSKITLGAGEETTIQVAFVDTAAALGSETTGTAAQGTADSAPKKSKLVFWIIGSVVFLAVIAVVVILVLKKKGIIFMSGLLIGCLLAETLLPGLHVSAAEVARRAETITCQIPGSEAAVTVDYRYDYNPEVEILKIDTSEFGYDNEGKTYTVNKKLDSIKGTLANPDTYASLTLEVYNAKGFLVDSYEMTPAEQWAFAEVGLFPGKNKIVVRAEGSNAAAADGSAASADGNSASTELYLTDIWGYNYEYVADADKDTDKDGLYDNFELYLGTDINKKDTDGDGLTDYQEVCEVGTDPLVVDTDNNGVSDYDEDADGDGLTNGEEYKLGTHPTISDSDFDGLDDGEEVRDYKTDPAKEDTDGDGANDGWEVANGFDPLKANKKFTVSVEPAEVSQDWVVSAGAKVTSKGTEGDVSSLEVTTVSAFEQYFCSPMVVGYLGRAYEFSYDGTFEEAELVFDYDTSLGELGEDFQPRIYYFNEETKSFEELPGQKVENGRVTAKTKHFSTYALLNKVEVDAAWKETIAYDPGSMDKLLGTSSFVFVFDTSASLAINDEYGLAKKAAEQIVGRMRTGKDKAAVISYTKDAKVVQRFTADSAKTLDTIQSLGYDNGLNSNSGTDGVTALTEAVKLSGDCKADYKYIFLFTDGKDTKSSSYKEVEKNALDKGIKIYTVGVGEANSKVLTEIAEATKGEYVGSNYKDALDEILLELILSSTDSNGDGIDDYFTELIRQGKILVSNGSLELRGIDLNYDADGNLSDDFDGDGLKNGEEIRVVTNGSKVYVEMTSSPFMVHSDGDAIDDYTEAMAGSDPLKYSINKSVVDLLTDDGGYNMEVFIDFQDNAFEKGVLLVGSGLYGVWNKDELYRDLIIDYYYNYATLDTLESQELYETKKLWFDILGDLSAGAQKCVDTSVNWYLFLVKTYGICSDINGLKNATDITNNFGEALSNLVIYSKENAEWARKINCRVCETEYVAKVINEPAIRNGITKANKILDGWSEIVVVIDFGVDAINTVTQLAKVNANQAAFKENMEVLKYIEDYSDDEHAQDAVRVIRRQLADSYLSYMETLGHDLVEFGAYEALYFVAKKCPYVAAVVFVRDVMDLLFGVSEDIKEEYQMLCYHEMILAYKHFLGEVSTVNGSFIEVDSSELSNFYRYLTHLTQIRILGEQKYYGWQEYGGWTGDFWNGVFDVDSIKRRINENIGYIKMVADALGLQLSSNMKYGV